MRLRIMSSALLVHGIFKRQGVVEYVLHEVELLSTELLASVEMFRTPLSLVQKFAASGAQGLAAAYRSATSACTEGLENLLACAVAAYRDDASQDAKRRALTDFLWSVRSTAFDDEIMELCFQDMQSNVAGPPRGGHHVSTFLWHRYLKETLAGDGHQRLSRVCRRPIAQSKGRLSSAIRS